MAAKPIKETEWLAELEKLQERNDEGLTAKEWAEVLGLGHEAALQRLKRAHGLGWLVVGKRRGVSISGRGILSPVYRIVRPKK